MIRRRAPSAPRLDDVEDRVVEVVRALARETGGARAERAVSATALARARGRPRQPRARRAAARGSSGTFGRALDDRCLAIDTPAGLARAILEPPSAGQPLALPAREATAGAAAAASAPGCARCRVALAPRPRRSRAACTSSCARTSGDEQPVTYGRPARGGGAVAGGLRARGVRRGDTVALMLPTGLDFLRVVRSGSCSRARSRCRSTRPCASTGSRSTPRASRRSSPTPACGCSSRSRARGRSPACWRRAVPTLDAVVTADELAGEAAPRPRARRRRLRTRPSSSTRPARPASPRACCSRTTTCSRTSARSRRGLAARADGRRRELAAALPRHGADRVLAHLPAPAACRSTLLPPTSFLARPERWLWAIHRRRGDALGRTELRLRAVRTARLRRGARGPRPLVVARRPERRRAGEPRARSSASRGASGRAASGARR